MPFRAKMKRAFGRDSPDDGSDQAQTNGKVSDKKKKKKKQKLPDNVYKPGEVMPRPKYRGPYDKEHQDQLTSFNFANAFTRRKSDYSEYSPMGSKLPSRRGSFLGFGRKSFARSRQPSYVDPALMESKEGDDDVTNGMGDSRTRSMGDSSSLLMIPQLACQDSRRTRRKKDRGPETARKDRGRRTV